MQWKRVCVFVTVAFPPSYIVSLVFEFLGQNGEADP